MVDMARQVEEQVVLIDHHKSAKEGLAFLANNHTWSRCCQSPVLLDGTTGNVSMCDTCGKICDVEATPKNLVIKFDMKKSGAMLTWEHFHPGVCPPSLVEYVQDRDLWSWKLPSSEEVSTFIQLQDFDFDLWEKLSQKLEDSTSFATLVGAGEAMLAYRDSFIEPICRKPGFTRIEGHLVPCVNATQWQSEIGNVLAKKHHFAVMWFMTQKGEYVYSLRSDKDRANEVADVSAIAGIFGGGGHVHAAGFRTNAAPMMVAAPESE